MRIAAIICEIWQSFELQKMWSNSRAHLIISGLLFTFVFFDQWCMLFANHVHNHHSTHGGTHTRWFRTEILDGNGLFILDWRKTTKDIIFRATVNTRGYIGIGFSYKSEKISDADIILAWIDDRTGEPNVLVNNIYYLWRCMRTICAGRFES